MLKFIKRFYKIKLKKAKKSHELINELSDIPDIEILNNKVPVQIRLNNINLLIYTLEDVFILRELYLNKDYYFSINEKCVFIDVGMNSGFTSLYIASNKNVSKIYSFEPASLTFEIAQSNLKINEILSKKIEAFHFGLGEGYHELDFIYSKEYKGSVGIRGLDSWNIANASDTELIKVEIRDASEVFNPILEKHKSEIIICKIDCEGSEFIILPNLAKSKLLIQIDFLIIEYHDVGPEKLERILNQENFLCIIKPTNAHLGIIYAFNKNKKI
jgi:FkbM family methyltransferase